MRRNPKIGLLPLYLKLYDDRMPERRPEFDPFLAKVEEEFVAGGVDVVRAEVCRLENEFQQAVDTFESEDVDPIVSLHLAYSPSLESAGALRRTDLPLLMLDTTMDHSFGIDVSPSRIMYNHGIHGVQDLANVLRRRGRAHEIVAGHVTESDVMPRAVSIARAALAARCLGNAKALRIGESFKGMGDFGVPETRMLEKLGIQVHQIGAAELVAEVEKIGAAQIEAEMTEDRARFTAELPDQVHQRSVRVGLGLRNYLEGGGFSAFSMNFLAFDKPDGAVNTVPFLEASKAMARGIGYAGEGDVLTASLVGALSSAFGDTTFTEIFCPDWKGGALFLSHMGEINPDTVAGKPRLCEKPFPWTPAENPAVVTGAVRPGPAVYVNLAPGPDDSFALIAAPVTVIGDSTDPEMQEVVRGWMRPACGLEDFLERYSACGGTHHSALVFDQTPATVVALARFAGLQCTVIE